MREARETKAATSMEGATQELERRSQYLSSLIQRTKVKSDDATPAAAIGDRQNQRNEKKDAELPSLQRVRRQERRHLELPHQHQQQKQIQHPPPPQAPPPMTATHQHLLRQDTKKKCVDYDEDGGDLQEELRNVRIRAADMPAALQKRAFRCAREILAAMPKLDSKRLALALKKEFDSSYGPAWHCIVGTSFGSYVTHSLGGFLYFSIDKVYILLFRTAVEPLGS